MNLRLVTIPLLLVLCVISVRADDWPQWLGPQRDAVWREAGIVDDFPEGGPKLRWRREVGGGFAGPAVAEGRVFIADRIADPTAKVTVPEKLGIAGAMNRPVLRNGYIYGDGPNGLYTCAEAATGKWRWTTYAPSTGDRPKRWANVFTVCIDNGGAHDRYILSNDQGELIFATLTPEGYRETSRARIIEPAGRVWGRPIVWSHPAFANRSVYQRNDREVVCFSMASTNNSQ